MSELNPLNDLSRVYLDHVANANQQNDDKDIKRWEEGNDALDKQMETSSKQLATLGAPTMEEEKKAAKDYDGDGEIESGTDEYFGSKDKAIKKAMKKEDTDNYVEAYVDALNKTSVGLDEADSLSGQVSRWEAARQKRMKQRQSYERPHWIPRDQDHEDNWGSSKGEKRKPQKKNANLQNEEGIADIIARLEKKRISKGGDPKDSPLPSMRKYHADKKNKVKEGRFSDWREDLIEIADNIPLTDKEAKKIVKERDDIDNKVEINPKMSEAVAQIGGEVISETEVELQEKHKDTPDQVKAVIAYDRARKGTDDATYDSMHGKKKQAKKERDYAKWQRDKGAEDAQKSGHRWKHAKGSTREKVGKKSETHAYIKDSYAAEGVLGTKAKGILGKEVKELEKANYTMKDTPVVKADKTANPNYKGQKFGVKEGDDWIQKAVKRPGAFTRKAKAAGQTVQQFAKTVDDNPGKYSTRTKRQANLAQTFASMKKEDVEELFYTLIAD